ncbi:hypothetical protein KIW84_064389 [Lathyrus oleraceus]|uniref:Large ribosomal subunit protein uL15/eL18 domain-containing protein n=1 Tax=Pisum sativum TaxID=3888 RepID=A0A9D4WA37_PEA|nr:hypothetical protein KIW84_064389 [Pisum sativum]
MFIVPELAFGRMMLDVTMKLIESYGVAVGIAEQAIVSIRTVFSYVRKSTIIALLERAAAIGALYNLAEVNLDSRLKIASERWAIDRFLEVIKTPHPVPEVCRKAAIIKTKRTAPKSDDIYLKLLVKLYRFLARRGSRLICHTNGNATSQSYSCVNQFSLQ